MSQTSTDPQPSNRPVKFFARREKIYPRRVKGRYRRLKWLAMSVTLLIYYLAPLVRWDRGPNTPDQAILIDLPARRAYWFFIEIWPQEVYYLTAILIFAAIALFFVTSLLGRVWCGYFCPQTVWTDLFVAVENMIQGDRVARQRLDKMPLCFEKLWKKSLTHVLWLLIGLATGGAFVFYFNDAPTLWGQILSFNVSPTVTGFIAALTGSTYLMAGFAREQVCTYMCPYARFQSGMFDKDTLIIGYDVARGEPRGKHKAGSSWEGHGHCIDCTACVQVCPMGIDIRKGLQMDCIACGLCIDACNDIMDKVKLPRGLIRYDTEHRIENKITDKKAWNFWRPRTFYYITILTIVAGLVIFGQVTRKPFELHVLHDRNPVMIRLSNGDIRNGYDLKILNKGHDTGNFSIRVENLQDARLDIRGAGHITPDHFPIAGNNVGTLHVFVTARAQKEISRKVFFILKNNATGHEEIYKSMFISGDR